MNMSNAYLVSDPHEAVLAWRCPDQVDEFKNRWGRLCDNFDTDLVLGLGSLKQILFDCANDSALLSNDTARFKRTQADHT